MINNDVENVKYDYKIMLTNIIKTKVTLSVKILPKFKKGVRWNFAKGQRLDFLVKFVKVPP